MTPKQLLARIVLMVVIGASASLFGAITAPAWAAGLLAFVIAIVFTGVSERLLRGKLFGKIGSGIISWFSVHLIGETAVFAALLGLCALFGVHAGGHLAFFVALGASWVVLCHEAIGKIVSLSLLYLATRR